MTGINPPPPDGPVSPIICHIPTGVVLVRIYDPTRWATNALTFRTHGPHQRFDHHRRSAAGYPQDDPERSVYYCAWSDSAGATEEALREAFASSLVEVFGDTGIVEFGDREVALPQLQRSVRLLDLRYNGAMRAGTIAAIAKCDHRDAQPWSRYFYETVGDFGTIDGLYYLNRHNDGPAVLLYERARAALVCTSDDLTRLDHPDPDFQHLIQEIMIDNNLHFGAI